MTDVLTHIIDLCATLRSVVLPSLGAHSARAHAGLAVGGDVTFGIDEQAEGVLRTYMAEQLPDWAYYSEDAGLQGATAPEVILVVDPIDGTRPAAAGFEAACVSVAAVAPTDSPRLADVVAGAVQEIKSGDLFVAERGAGCRMTRRDGRPIPAAPTTGADLERLFWTMGWRGRPAVLLARVMEGLVDVSSVGGAVFETGSATYSLTRILTGQLDAYVDIGPAIITARPWTEAEFRRVGRGHVLCNSPYDLAAVYLICREAGIPISGGFGESLDDRLVLGSDAAFQLACIASGNDELQQRLVEVVARGIAALEPAAPA